MRFLFYFRLSSYLLIASGFLALLVTDDYGLLAALIFALILVLGWQVDSGKFTFRLSPFWWNLATIAFLGLCVADAVFLRQLKSVALVNFLVFLQTTKIFTPKQQRDYSTMYIISFFLLLASSIMTLSLLFAVSCIVFAVSATWALIMLHLKKEIETHILPKTDHPGIDAEDGRDRVQVEQAAFNTPPINALLNLRFFTTTLGITLLSFGMALIVFAILPRMREGIFFRYGTDFSQRISGFSEEVALDGFGTIRLDHRPVIRVMLPEISDQAQFPGKLYWKGLAYNSYDGKRWRADSKSRKQFSVQAQDQNLYWFKWQPSTKNLLAQRVELFSPRFEVLFGSDKIYAVEGKFLSLSQDKNTGNTHVVFNPAALNYTAYSDVAVPTAEALRHEQSNYPDVINALYLQLPPLSERVKELADQLGNGYDNAYDKALAIQNFLLQNYTYSLDVKRSSDVLPLEDFLFVHKAGHCEYYATSMAILLRIHGIPTRVVNGFAQGRWNEFGQFFTVRQSDAHAWVEVFFPSYGWVMFDPTPAAAFAETYQQFAERKSLAASLYRYYESLRARWERYIVDYSRDDQTQAIIGTFKAVRSTRQHFKDALARIKSRLANTEIHVSWREIGEIIGIMSAGLLLAYLVARLFARFQIRLPAFRKRRNLPATTIIRFYAAMLRILAKKGITKPSSATPGEFARYVAQHQADYGNAVRELTDLYHAVRYGRTELTHADVLQIERLLRTMKKKHGSRVAR